MGKASTFPPQPFRLLPELKSPAIFIMHYVLPNVISQFLAFTEALELNHFKGWGKVEPMCMSFCKFHLTITELKKITLRREISILQCIFILIGANNTLYPPP